MKRSPLKRKTPMRRKNQPGAQARDLRKRDWASGIASAKPSKYRQRERDTEYMLWIKQQPCHARALCCGLTRWCRGPVEADHAGRRGMGQKADDRTCIPLCSKHHRERTDFSGLFKGWSQERMRGWLAESVVFYQKRYGEYRETISKMITDLERRWEAA